MSDGKSFKQVIQAIHEAIGTAERLLPKLGENLRFVVGPLGQMEIVRRGEQGETLRPKIVIAELKGCDSMLWRPEHPAWMGVLDPRRALPRNKTNGENGGSEPPLGAAGSN